MKFSQALILPFAIFLLSISSVHAQDASTSASQLRDSVKQKVDEELAQIKQAVSKKAFLASISSKSEATFSLTNYLSQPRSALISTDTVIKLKNGSDGTPADLKSGDWILAMGDVDGAGNMTTKRLLVVGAPLTDKRAIVFGKVISVGASLTVETPDKNQSTAKLASDTTITGIVNGKSAKLKTTDIKVGNQVVFITKTGTASTVATDLYLFP
jgi:hypothetical protein